MSGRSAAWSALGGALAGVALVVAASAVAADATAPREALFEGGARRLEVGPVPAGTGGIDAGACALCHVEIAAEWRASLHRESWSNAVFQAAYAHESLAFCRNCHAPLHQGNVPTGVAASEGISCAVCHVREGTVLGTGRSVASHAVAPHPVRVEPRLARVDIAAVATSSGSSRVGVRAGTGSRRRSYSSRRSASGTPGTSRARRARVASTVTCRGVQVAGTRVVGSTGITRSGRGAIRRRSRAR